MFQSCPSLTTAPVLPAPTLVEGCYGMMFSGCTSLNFVTCLATDISANYCTSNWLDDVASKGTFFTPNTTNWTVGASGIPSGWTRANGEGYPLTPFTLEALMNGEINMINNGIAMKYSKNGGPKITVDPNDGAIINVSEGDKVAFYCNGTNTASYNGIRFVGTANVKAYGNIMSLFDEDNYSTANELPVEEALIALFNSNEKLIDASGLLLPATTLAEYCY